MRRITWCFLTSLLVGLPALARAEDITVSTYYPSPRGVYQELRTTDNTYLATLAGNVGIGTANPGGKFAVMTGANQVLRVNPAAGYATPTDFSIGGVELGLSRSTDGGIVSGLFSYDTAGAAKDNLGISARSDIVFLAGLSGIGGAPERMRILDNGNVGIGTPAPEHELDVAGIIQSRTGTGESRYDFYRTGGATDAKRWRIYTPNDTSLYFQALNDAVTAAGTAIQIDRSGNSVTQVLFPSGNVGIGTANPSQKLQIVNGTSAPILSLGLPTSGNPGSGVLFLGASATRKNWFIGNQYNVDGGLEFTQTTATGGATIGSTPAMTIDLSGNVGIGTTDPKERLHVSGGKLRVTEGTQATFGGHLYLAKTDGTPGNGLWHFNITPTGIAGVTGNALNFVESGIADYRLVIAPGGTVGIGTAAPDPAYLLDVNGQIRGTTVWGSSDARFKTDLEPLTDVLPKLAALHSISYTRSALALSLGQPPTPHRELGVTGQELEQVFPELVSRTGPENYRAVDYSRLTVVLLEAVKELEQRVAELESSHRKDAKESQRTQKP